ncbi:MAG TPA: orotidine-5'-phosphate decarboxylase [Candidatus Paceibacterota bacterium]
MKDSKFILAADELTLAQCLKLAPKIGDRVYAIKIHNLYDKEGWAAIESLKRAAPWLVWVDAKLHDIPNTAKLRAQALRDAGADIISAHVSGEVEMMMAAKESGALIYAVTALTSLSEEQVHLLHGHPSKAAVLYLARLAKLAGMDGIVCSPKEVSIVANRLELKGMEIVTPGVRSVGKDTHDQQRFDTPTATIKAGASRLVIGRQLTLAEDPVAALDELEKEISTI